MLCLSTEGLRFPRRMHSPPKHARTFEDALALLLSPSVHTRSDPGTRSRTGSTLVRVYHLHKKVLFPRFSLRGRMNKDGRRRKRKYRGTLLYYAEIMAPVCRKRRRIFSFLGFCTFPLLPRRKKGVASSFPSARYKRDLALKEVRKKKIPDYRGPAGHHFLSFHLVWPTTKEIQK